MKKVIVAVLVLMSSSVFASDGADLYKKCAACHGVKAEKKALGKSQVIAGWEAQKTADAIKGYQDGTYGEAMKGLMKTQVLNLKDEEIQTLAKYIESL
ncbi:MAG: c-type cytochrome [Sulfurospirillum sp.]|nr:c-type cytochrome [Sulfurospirillum sp.]